VCRDFFLHLIKLEAECTILYQVKGEATTFGYPNFIYSYYLKIGIGIQKLLFNTQITKIVYTGFLPTSWVIEVFLILCVHVNLNDEYTKT
jgi:hypothetical protein